MVTRAGLPWFLVCETPDAEYPKPHFSGFFEVTDRRIPPGWSACLSKTGNYPGFALLPGPWAEDPHFMEGLVEGGPDATEVFSLIRTSLRSWHGMD